MRSSQEESPPVFVSPYDLHPRVMLAGCYHYPEVIWFEFRALSHHLILVETGALRARTVDGELTAGTHDLVYFRPAPVNQYGVTAGTVYYQISLNVPAPPREWWPLGLDSIGLFPARVPLGDSFEEMRALFEAVCMELGESGDVHRLRGISAVYALLALAVQVASAHDSAPPDLDWLQRARLRLEGEPDADLQIARLAQELGVTPSHFIRQFKTRFGLSPKAFQTHLRIREAVRLLRETAMSVKRIALQLGWRDAKTLTGHLRAILGKSPTEIRSGASPQDIALPGGKLFPVNLHVVPPEAGPDYFDRWMLPGRRDPTTQASSARLRRQFQTGSGQHHGR